MEIFYISDSDNTTYHCPTASQLHAQFRGVLDENGQGRLIEGEPQTYNEPKASKKTTEIFVPRFI